jgi:tRNA (guanine37-N1)-methyltransferase
MMWFGVVTLFPEMFTSITESGVTSRAIKRSQVAVEFWNPRDFTQDKHRTVDDRPYGGGPGMLMKVEPLRLAIQAAKSRANAVCGDAKVIYLSPQGSVLKQADSTKMSQEKGLIFVAGRYEGIDQRLIESEIDEEWSIGDYVLSGGELPAMVLMDTIIRQIPGVLGHQLSAEQDSFSEGLLDCPHYTRPENLGDECVPEVLLSGDHAKIATWRLKQSLGRTWLKRPDLLGSKTLSVEHQVLLEEFIQEFKISRSGV